MSDAAELPLIRLLSRGLATWRFPAYAICLLEGYTLLLCVVLALPVGDDAVGRFAEEFKTWCFGYDPATGHSQVIYVAMMLTEPLLLAAIVTGVWWGPLQEVRAAPRRLLPYAGAALVSLVAGVGTLLSISGDPVRGELPFPGERIRTSIPSPGFTLVDHEGQPLGSGALQGKVVVVTGIYATCGYTCPMLLGQARRAVEALSEEERREITVVGISLDSAHDTPAQLAKMAEGQGVRAPTFRLGTGEPAAVEQTLDAFGISRSRNAETGAIDHQNVFMVLDRGGKIAYRLALGDRQQEWLIAALRQLVAEREPLG